MTAGGIWLAMRCWSLAHIACSRLLQTKVGFRATGGEEFLVLLLEQSPEQAEVLATRICQGIGQLQVRCGSVESLHVTVSIGVATQAIDRIEAIFKLIHQADQALYQAKARGRNQVVMSAAEA